MSPYRVAPEAPDEACDCPDRELFFVMLGFWCLSLARVVGAARREAFGAEGSLAVVCVVLVPWLMKDSGLWLLGQCRAAATRHVSRRAAGPAARAVEGRRRS